MVADVVTTVGAFAVAMNPILVYGGAGAAAVGAMPAGAMSLGAGWYSRFTTKMSGHSILFVRRSSR